MKSHGKSEAMKIVTFLIVLSGISLLLYLALVWYATFNLDNVRDYCLPGVPGDIGFALDDNDFCKLNFMYILKESVLFSVVLLTLYVGIAYTFFIICKKLCK